MVSAVPHTTQDGFTCGTNFNRGNQTLHTTGNIIIIADNSRHYGCPLRNENGEFSPIEVEILHGVNGHATGTCSAGGDIRRKMWPKPYRTEALRADYGNGEAAEGAAAPKGLPPQEQ